MPTNPSLFRPRLLPWLMLSIWLLAAPATAAPAEYRALWVDLFHEGIRTPGEADTMLATARKAGYNTVIIQVRKACDAYYNSTVEPRSPNLAGNFDPLGYITEKAHSTPGGQQRLEVHAWLVTYRARLPYDDLWKDPRHVYTAHPDWLSRKKDGETASKGESSGRYYLDPGVPAVIDHNLMVVRDILSKYDVDGIVFDYIRYPESEGDVGNTWGYNPTAIQRFNKLNGTTGDPAANDKSFSAFRRRQISDQVRKVYAHVRSWRPRVKVGAAAISWGRLQENFEHSSAYSDIFQDWPGMAREGWLDLIMPMNYMSESIGWQREAHRQWAKFLADLSVETGRFGINIVDGENKNSLPDILAQMRDTRVLPGLDGISTYSYAQTRKGQSGENVPDAPFYEAIAKAFESRAPVPEAPWIDRPVDGLIKGVVSRKGVAIDGATVQLGNRTTHTDGTGFYAFSRVTAGQHTLSAEDASGTIGTTAAVVTAGKVAEAPINQP